MIKTTLTVVGSVYFLAGIVVSLGRDVNEDNIPAAICFTIFVLCLGFIGIIEAIERLKEKAKQEDKV